jgi:hypothetical protein
MLLFGLSIVWASWCVRRGGSKPLFVVGLIGILYLVTGMGGMMYRHDDSFMSFFIVLGMLLLICSYALAKKTPQH